MYTIKYFNIDTEERLEFHVSGYRDLESKLEQAGISEYDPFWRKLGTSDVIPIGE